MPLTPEQHEIIKSLVDTHDLNHEQISFKDESTDPILDYEALNLLRLRLTDIEASQPYIAERDTESGFVTAMVTITRKDGKKASDVGTAFVGEIMYSGNEIKSIVKAQNLAIARAMRRAIRAAGINIYTAHQRFIETGELTTTEGFESKPLDTRAKDLREIHALRDGFGHSDGEYRAFLTRLFGASSSVDLDGIQRSQLIATYRAMISERQKTGVAVEKLAA